MAGPFSLVSGSPQRVVVRRPGLTVVFRRLPARAARREFLQGTLDEAPVPLGDLVAAKRDARLRDSVRARILLGLDVVVLRLSNPELRRVYSETANRGDYEQLVSGLPGSASYGFVGAREPDPAAFRRALRSIRSLPRVAVRLGVPDDPVLRSGARVLYADWRDAGLGPRLAVDAASKLDGSFRRVLAAYAQAEAIPAQLVLRDGVPGRGALLRALAATDQAPELRRLDGFLRASAFAIPVAWVVDARLVSRRLEGWREDALGNVDYAAVRSRASSQRP